jgi:ABC-type transporter Mla subunit MlaD
MNNKWFKIGIFALVLAILAVGAVAAYAQGPRGGGMGGPENGLVAVAAEVIGIEQTELVAALNDGQTIAEVAKAHDVALQDIVDAFVADRAEWMASAVESGSLTQEQVDLMLANMSEHIALRLAQPFEPQGMGFMNGNGMGMMGRGMHGGMGHGMGPGWRMGPGMGYSDADGDGLCDHCPFTADADL